MLRSMQGLVYDMDLIMEGFFQNTELSVLQLQAVFISCSYNAAAQCERHELEKYIYIA